VKTCHKLITPFLFALLIFGCQTTSNTSQPPVIEKPKPEPVITSRAKKVHGESYTEETLSTPKTVRLQVKNAPTDVNAMGFEIWFNPNALEFEGFDRIGLMKQGFAIFASNVVSPGKLRMGGVQVGKTPISKGVSGEMLFLNFRVLDSGEPNFTIMENIDNLETWATRVSSCTELDDFAGLELCK